MSYETIGLHARPLGAYLPQLCDSLKRAASGGSAVSTGWEARLAEACLGNGNLHPRKMLSTITLNDLLMCKGSTAFAPGTPAFNSLMHLHCRLLHELGYMKVVPFAVEYRAHYELTIDEVLDRMVSQLIQFPQGTDIGNGEHVWAAYVACLPVFIRKLDYLDKQRDALLARLRTKVCAIAHGIALGQTPGDAERSLLLHLGFGADRSISSRDSGHVSPLYLAPSGDPLVAEAFQLYQQAVGIGPVSKYLRLITAAAGTSRVMYVGPGPRPLPVGAGYFSFKGPFVRFDLTSIFTIPWSDDSQLEAILESESSVLARTDRDPFVLPPPVVAATSAGSAPFTSLDDPAFRFSYTAAPNAAKEWLVSQMDVDYHSSFVGRNLSTSVGTFPGAMIMLYDHVMAKTSWGQGAVSDLDISDFALIDMAWSVNIPLPRDATDTPGVSGPAIVKGSVMQEFITWVSTARSEVLSTRVDLTPLYFRGGGVLALPPLREHVIPPRAWAFSPDDAAVEFIAGKLGLTEQERRVAEEPIRVSHNMHRLRLLLTDKNVPAVSPEVVASIRLAHTGFVRSHGYERRS